MTQRRSENNDSELNKTRIICITSVLTYYATIRLNPKRDRVTFELKIGTPVTPVLGNIHTNFGFSAPLRFRVRSLCVTERQTDRRTDGRTGKSRDAAC